ncbi:rRNA maturation RNase YbeY [Chthonomonas calidirosea]|uniref:rRNA maturation RNase YbeY n=1 Tax=Chthonomonas calidirosea TaxID=454171 RepID=UPI001E28A84C|nr:rRNA maturation RNase YbeY [Chthonomonas calidirosea]
MICRNYPKRVPTLPLRRAVRQLLQSEGRSRAEVSILLTNDTEVHQLNLLYRGKDSPTDVLSFGQYTAPSDRVSLLSTDGLPLLLGDVVISVDTAIRQAQQHSLALADELALLAVHGTLHLLGYEDETEQGAAIMRLKEREILGVSLDPVEKL